MSGGYGAIFDKIKSIASSGSKKAGRGNRAQHLDSTPSASSRTSRVDMSGRDVQTPQRQTDARPASRNAGRMMRRTDRG